MWNRLHQASWIFLWLMLLGWGTGAAHAAQVQNTTSPTTITPTGTFSKFAGTWVAHGALMVISDDGQAQFEARTYNWCGPDVVQPCDSIQNNQIYYGYHEQLVLASVNDAMAYGTLLTSNSPPTDPNTAITLRLGSDDTLIYTKSSSITTLCGPQAPAGTCGA